MNTIEQIKPFGELTLEDIKQVGGKNSSLGEMYRELASKGIRVPDGFAVTVNAYWSFIEQNGLHHALAKLMESLDRENFSNLNEVGQKARDLILEGTIPNNLQLAIQQGYRGLSGGKSNISVAVRSSATAEDLPSASFAGQHDSYLNIHGEHALLHAVQNCFASLFTNRAIKYREDNHFDHMKVGLSVGVQRMVRADLACSGVGFTIEPESGFKDIILLTGVWGLGENIVQGTVTPDEFMVYKPNLRNGKKALIARKLGDKAKTLVYNDGNRYSFSNPVLNVDTTNEKRQSFVLSEEEVTRLANWCLIIEDHYGRSMDIEWAKDGETGEIFILQARPETVRSRQDPYQVHEFTLLQKSKVLAQGEAIGNKIVSGTARIIQSPAESDRVKPGEILITDMTSPDWDPILRKVGAIVTDKGGRTSHASIVARELGVAAVVGTGHATDHIQDGQVVTICCSEGETGTIYEGKLQWKEQEINLKSLKQPATSPMLILADPDKAFKLSFYPSRGVGLMRLEFIINNSIQVHPMALVRFQELEDSKEKAAIEELTRQYPRKEQYFVDQLAQAVATIACAFFPRDVIVRMSDFKTNEYANLLGGKQFEPKEENPMLGFRGASRYYHEKYKEGFRLECEALHKVREEMGLTNVKLMIPFCRTVEEGKKVVALMEEYGLKRGVNDLEIYVMAEIPSNVLLAEQFAEYFDGFSIGSNDLTQLTLGIDRDSSVISSLFDEKNEAPKQMISLVIQKARKAGRKIGLCGQAPSDFPDFARFLVEQGIDSISFNPDALLRGIENINLAESTVKSLRKELVMDH